MFVCRRDDLEDPSLLYCIYRNYAGVFLSGCCITTADSILTKLFSEDSSSEPSLAYHQGKCNTVGPVCKADVSTSNAMVGVGNHWFRVWDQLRKKQNWKKNSIVLYQATGSLTQSTYTSIDLK